MGKKIDISADVGEGFALYKLGRYDEIMPYLTSCNCACGWHAGGPDKMRATAKLAKQFNVQMGAHPGYPDLLGFGRRNMKLTKDETRDYILYQVGALNAFTKPLGLKIKHLLPHGAWSLVAWGDETTSEGFVEALQEWDPEMVLVVSPPSVTYKVAKKAGIRVACIYLPEMNYNREGNTTIIRKYEPPDANKIASKIVKLAKTGKIETVDGVDIDFPAQQVNVHGDNPKAPELLQIIKTKLEEEGIERVPLDELTP